MAVLQDGGVSDREDVPAEGLDLTNECCKYLSRMERYLDPTLLLLWLGRERSLTDSVGDKACPRSSVVLQLEQCECSTGCTRRDVPGVEQQQPSFSYPLATLPRFRSALKPIHAGLTVIRLVAAFGLPAGQQQLTRRDRLNLAFAAIQSKKNGRFAFAAMHAEIPPRIGGFG